MTDFNFTSTENKSTYRFKQDRYSSI